MVAFHFINEDKRICSNFPESRFALVHFIWLSTYNEPGSNPLLKYDSPNLCKVVSQADIWDFCNFRKT